MMQRHDDPSIQAAYNAWCDSTLHKAEHVLDCHSGCTDRAMQCPIGMLVAEQERALWRAYYDIRIAAGVEVAIS